MRCGTRLRAGRREGVGLRRHKRHAREKARLEAVGGQGTRGAHLEHVAHGRDLGGVKAQRLVERPRVLPSRREGHAMRGEVRAGRREGVRRWRRKRHARGKARIKAVGGQGTRGAHVEHVVHLRDLGGVNAQRLVERVRGLPSRREGHMRCGARLRAGRWENVGRRRRKRHPRRKARLKAVGGQGTRGAHVEHGAHVRDLGGVKAQRLIERQRVLPSRREGHAMRGEVRAGRREGVGRRRRKRRARGMPDSRREGQGTRGAHCEHAVHVRDLGGVKAQQLIEDVRALPSRREKHGMRHAGRGAGREAGGRGAVAAQAACTGGRPGLKAWGQGHARSAPGTCGACS